MDSELLHDQPLLEVRDLHVEFATDLGSVTAVDGVSLCIPQNKTVALVGESGCGKSVTALSLLQLIPQPPGRISAGQILCSMSGNERPVDLLNLHPREITGVRGKHIGMIFQDPMSSLNPVLSVGHQIVEAIELHRGLRGKAARSTAVEMLKRVGIPEADSRFNAFPHQLSGGTLQRVMIAVALASRPALLVADEPTTALDVTVQAQILELLSRLQESTRMSILLITHDLDVVAEIAHYVYVMYAGKIVEHAPTARLLSNPIHPYTQGLMRCAPRVSEKRDRLDVIPGSPADPRCFPSGCRFHPRCSLSVERANAGKRVKACLDGSPTTLILRRCIERFDGEYSGDPPLSERQASHFVACWEA